MRQAEAEAVGDRESAVLVRPGTADGDVQSRCRLRQQSIFNELGEYPRPAYLIAVQNPLV